MEKFCPYIKDTCNSKCVFKMGSAKKMSDGEETECRLVYSADPVEERTVQMRYLRRPNAH